MTEKTTLGKSRVYKMWVCDHCGDNAEVEPGGLCEVCSEGTIQVVPMVPVSPPAIVGATGQPYSDITRQHVYEACGLWSDRSLIDCALGAAHDRSALGLEASVHAGSYRQELLLEIADSFRSAPDVLECEDVALFAMETRARVRREVIEEVYAKLRSVARDATDSGVAVWFDEVADFLLREFVAVEVPDGQ